MNSLALKIFSRCGRKAQRMTAYNILRMSSTDEPCSTKHQESSSPKHHDPCSPKHHDPCSTKHDSASVKHHEPSSSKHHEPCPTKQQEPCSMKQQEPCPSKQEPCSPTKGTSSLPPCPPPPKAPSGPTCPPFLGPKDPCNYCPPTIKDHTEPNLIKLKKLQCLFQKDDDVPIYLKRGKIDVVCYQLALIMVLVSFATAMYSTVKLILK